MRFLKADDADQKTKFESYKTKPFSVPVLCFKIY